MLMGCLSVSVWEREWQRLAVIVVVISLLLFFVFVFFFPSCFFCCLSPLHCIHSSFPSPLPGPSSEHPELELEGGRWRDLPRWAEAGLHRPELSGAGPVHHAGQPLLYEVVHQGIESHHSSGAPWTVIYVAKRFSEVQSIRHDAPLPKDLWNSLAPLRGERPSSLDVL